MGEREGEGGGGRREGGEVEEMEEEREREQMGREHSVGRPGPDSWTSPPRPIGKSPAPCGLVTGGHAAGAHVSAEIPAFLKGH